MEGAAEEVKIKFRIAEARKGWRNRPYAQGGFSQQCGPIRFRAMGATHLYNLAQAFIANAGFITHAGWARNLFPPLPQFAAKKKTNNARKREKNRQRARESGGPTEYSGMRNFTSLTPPTQGRPIPNVRANYEFECVTWTTHPSEATPSRGRNSPGCNPPVSRSLKRGAASRRTLVSPSAARTRSPRTVCDSPPPAASTRSPDHLLPMPAGYSRNGLPGTPRRSSSRS